MAYDFERWIADDIAARRHRWVRWAVLAGLVAGPFAVAAELVDAAGWWGVAGSLAAVAASAGFLGAFFSPFLADYGAQLRRRPTRSLDEHQEAVLSRAVVASYAVVMGLAIAGLFYASFSHSYALPMPDDEGWSALGRFAGIAVLLLPVTIAEWSLPLPPAGEEEA